MRVFLLLATFILTGCDSITSPSLVILKYKEYGASFSDNGRTRIETYIQDIRENASYYWVVEVGAYSPEGFNSSVGPKYCGASGIDPIYHWIWVAVSIGDVECIKRFNNQGIHYVVDPQSLELKVIDREFRCYILPYFGVHKPDDSCFLPHTN